MNHLQLPKSQLSLSNHVPESLSTFYMSATCHRRDTAKVRFNYDLNLEGHNGLLWLSTPWPVTLEGVKGDPNEALGQRKRVDRR